MMSVPLHPLLPTSAAPAAPAPVVHVDADATHLPNGKTPLKDIAEYTHVDVLCGRGGGTNHHTGNNHWRALVSANKRLYISLPKKQKVLVAKSIVHAIRTQPHPHGGRFLQKDPDTSLWNDIGDQKATEKTSQALREGAPDIRSEMEAEKTKAKAMPRGSDAYRPGQILPNGLITLDYEGVQLSALKSTGPVKDGTIDVSSAMVQASHAFAPQQMQQQLQLLQGQMQGQMQPGQAGAQPPPPPGVDPMMMAFQQFMGVKQQQPQQQTKADAVASFQQLLHTSGKSDAGGATAATMKVPAPAVVSSNAVLQQQPQKPLSRKNSEQSTPSTAAPPSHAQPAAANAPQPVPAMPDLRQFSSLTGSFIQSAPATSTNETTTNAAPSALPPFGRAISILQGAAMGGTLTHAAPAPASVPAGARTAGPAPTMTREMALQMLRREKAQKAQRAKEEDARFKTTYLQTLTGAAPAATANGGSGIANGLATGPAGDFPSLANSLLGTQAFLAAQRNGAAAQPVPAPLPTPEEVSRMSDAQIRETLQRLQGQRQSPAAADPYGLTGLVRGSSLMGGGGLQSHLLGVSGSGLTGSLANRLPNPAPAALASVDQRAVEYANQHLLSGAGLPPSSLAAQTTLTSLKSMDSVGLQQAILDAMQSLDKGDPLSREGMESLGPTPLRPGVSAALTQLKMGNGSDAGARQGAGASKPIFYVPPPPTATREAVGNHSENATPARNKLIALKTGVALSEQLPMTSAPKRTSTGGSIDDLCRAAGFIQGPAGSKTSAGSSTLKPGKTDADLLGDSDHGIDSSFGEASIGKTTPASRKMSAGLKKKMYALQQAQEWENIKKVSSAREAALKLGRNDQSLMDDSDNDSDDDKPLASLTKRKSSGSSTSKGKARRPTFEERAAKRVATRTGGGKEEKHESEDRPAHAGALSDGKPVDGAPSLDRGLSFNRGVSFGLTETMLDRGHSLAMSEISLDRGPSLSFGNNGGLFAGGSAGDEGQFDDASEDEGTGAALESTAMKRDMTLGTMHTFSDLISQKSGALGR